MVEQLSCECYAAVKKESDRIASMMVIPGA